MTRLPGGTGSEGGGDGVKVSVSQSTGDDGFPRFHKLLPYLA